MPDTEATLILATFHQQQSHPHSPWEETSSSWRCVLFFSWVRTEELPQWAVWGAFYADSWPVLGAWQQQVVRGPRETAVGGAQVSQSH